MIQLPHLEALLLVPVWLAAAWFFPKAGLLKPFRVAIGLLLMLAWMNPHTNRQGRGLDLWVLVDRSSSAKDWIEPRLPEMQALLEQSRGRHDRLMFVDFAEDAIERDPLQSAILSGRLDSTRIGSAIHFALSRINPKRSSRLLILTDGFSTEPLEDASSRLVKQGVPMDLRLMTPPDNTDFRIADLLAPVHVRPGEPFVVEARIAGTEDADVACVLYRDDVVAGRSVAKIRRGRASVRWTDMIPQSGASEYEVVIEPVHDAWPGNNRQNSWVEAKGGQRVLLVSSYQDDPIAGALAAQGISVEVASDVSTLKGGHLTGVSLVILNNIPAYALPNAFLEAIPFYVNEQGGGLIMIGGRTSFAAGGYYQSPVDEIMPVSMELKQEHRKLAVAMAIVMDRSGSMAAGVPGASGLTKMDLANDGAARAIELLGDSDAVTVFAVDSEPHQVIPLTTLGENRGGILSIVRKVQSAGGGIFVFVGLQAGWEELKKAEQGQRHIILFADAADSEEAVGYETLVDEMVASGATLSVIALGTDQDVDADLLKAIAARGKGRILFNADASTLPALFAQETVALSRSAFLTDPVPIVAQPGWLEMAADSLPWPSHVDGYNLSYVRPGASASLITGDEYEAPLLAQWVRGVGRVAAVSFPMAGEYSATVRAWDHYGDFVRTMCRWTMREDMPAGLALRTERIGETLRIQLHHDDEWINTLATTPPLLITTSTEQKETERHQWRRIRPGLFETELHLSGSTVVNGAVQLGKRVIPFGPVCGAIGAEWQFDQAMPGTLQQMAQISGGQSRIDLSSIWSSPQRNDVRGLRDVLLIMTLVLFLAEALWTRVGWQLPSIGRVIPIKSQKIIPAKKSIPDHAAENAEITPPVSMPETPSASRKTMFEKARRRDRS